jgi:DNA-binding response OmpR family regulator
MDPAPWSTQRSFDLLVLDVRLPDGSGFEFARSVKQRRPSLSVLFVSAYPDG